MYSVTNCKQIFIGRKGETGTRSITFDVSSWLELNNTLEISIVAIRPGETSAYIPDGVTVSDEVLKWVPDLTDTAIPGTGVMLIRGTDAGGNVIKSVQMSYVVDNSFDDEGYEPTPTEESWLTQAEEKLAAMVAEGVAGEAAEWLEENITQETGYVIDTSLTVTGAAADAKKVGDEIGIINDELTNYNSAQMIKNIAHNSATNQDITYSWSGNVCTVTGKASAASINNIISNGIPSAYGFEVGKTYYVHYSATNVRFRVYCKVDGTSTEIINVINDASFTIPAGTTDMTLRLTVPNGTTVSETVSPIILKEPSNADLKNSIAETDSVRRKEAGIGTPYLAPWSVQLTNDKFSLLDMPQNTIAYTMFEYINSAQVADFPISDLGAVYIEKLGRGSNNTYRIYGNDRENVVTGYYISSAFHWYAMPCTKKLRIGMLGDSVIKGRIGGSQDTTSKGIPYWVAYETGLPVVNLGVGSQGWISKQYLDQNAEEYIQTLDLSGYDILTFMYGVNDGDISLGTYMDTTQQTIMGAAFRCIDYAYTQNANLRIIMINHPLGTSTNFPHFNPSAQHSAPDHWRFTDYFEQMRLFCAKYAIPLIEGWQALNAWNRDTYIGDNVHPTVAGYKVIGQYIAGQIKSMI